MTASMTPCAALVAAAALLTPAGQAVAQGSGVFERDRNVSVQERARSEYDAVGVRSGGLTIYPSLTAGLEYDDNIYATDANEAESGVLTLRPEVSVESGWSRHELAVSARVEHRTVFEDSDEDTFGGYIGADGVLDFASDTEIGGGASYLSDHESRTSSASPATAVEPIEYEVANLYGTASKAFNRLALSTRLDWRAFDFEDGVTPGGAVLEQDDRDRDQIDVSARGDYAISPATALFAEAAFNTRDYDREPPVTPITRDSDGVEILAGANFDITRVMRGEVAIGWFEQEFDDPAFDSVDGFDVRAGVEWFPSQLTTIGFTAARDVEDSGVAGSPAYVSSAASARIDHELLRNLILSAELTYSDDDYEGIDRNDERTGAGLEATWMINRSVGLSPYYQYMELDSSGAFQGQDYAINRIGVELTLAR